MEDCDRHGRYEDRKVKPEGADQKEHENDRFHIRASPHIQKAFDETAARAKCLMPRVKFVHPKETQRAQHGSKRDPR